MSEILISSLRVQTHIGVPDDERAEMQELELDLHITPSMGFQEMRDQISNTIDYTKVCERVAEIASARPRNLIETLADEVADAILSEFGASRVEVELRKFILPETRHVAVRCTRTRS